MQKLIFETGCHIYSFSYVAFAQEQGSVCNDKLSKIRLRIDREILRSNLLIQGIEDSLGEIRLMLGDVRERASTNNSFDFFGKPSKSAELLPRIL